MHLVPFFERGSGVHFSQTLVRPDSFGEGVLTSGKSLTKGAAAAEEVLARGEVLMGGELVTGEEVLTGVVRAGRLPDDSRLLGDPLVAPSLSEVATLSAFTAVLFFEKLGDKALFD